MSDDLSSSAPHNPVTAPPAPGSSRLIQANADFEARLKQAQKELDETKKALNDTISAHDELEKEHKTLKKTYKAEQGQNDALKISNEQTQWAHLTQVAELEVKVRHLELVETELRKRPTLPQHELVNTSLKEAQSALKELQNKFDEAKTASESLQRLRVEHETLQIDTKKRPTHEAYETATNNVMRWKERYEKQAADKTEVEKQRAQFFVDIGFLRTQAIEMAKELDDAKAEVDRNKAHNARVDTLRSQLDAARSEAAQLKQQHTQTQERLAGLEADVQSIIIDRDEAMGRANHLHDIVLKFETELQTPGELTMHDVGVKEELIKLRQLLITRDSEIERPSAVEEKLEDLREDYYVTLGEAGALNDEVYRLRDQLGRAQDELEEAFDREEDLKYCRTKLLQFMIHAIRIIPDAELIEDMRYNPPRRIVSRTLSYLRVCSFVFSRMESLAAEILDAHKTTSGLLRRAELVIPKMRNNLCDAGRIIEMLRGEKAALVRRAETLQQTIIRLDAQVRRLRNQVMHSMDTCAILQESRDSLAA
jgi:chromosome segregation ATPase